MRAILLLAAGFILASCTELGLPKFSSFESNSAFGNNSAAVNDTSRADFYPDDQLLVSAKVQFRDGNYGKSYTLFKKATDVVPSDPAAWLGYAASADMLRRFKASDKAYAKLRGVIGNTPEYHNNYGYSQLLRGDLVTARAHFLIAYEMDPSNETTANNLELLRNSVNYPRRSAGMSQGI